MTHITTAFDDLVNVGNKANQISQIFGDLQKDTIGDDPNKQGRAADRDFVGSNGHVGDGEFRDLMGGVFNYRHVDRDKDGELSDGDIYINDAYDLLNEMLTGDGIEGVELVGLDGDSFTLAVDGKGGSTDFMVFEGRAAEEAIAMVDAQQVNGVTGNVFDLNAGNGVSQFAILDLSAEAGDPSLSLRIGDSGELSSDLDVGNNLDAEDVPAILEQVLTMGGYAGVELIDVDASSIALSFNGGNGSKDTLLITGIEDALALVEGGPLNDFLNNTNTRTQSNDFEINGPTNVPDGSLLDSFNFGNQISNSDITRGNGDTNLLDALVAAGGSISDADETISIIGVDSDSFTFSYEQTVGEETFRDIFVLDYADEMM